jgi:hypothetical protein
MARRGRARRRRGLAPHTAHSTSGQQWGAAWQGTAGQMQGGARLGSARLGSTHCPFNEWAAVGRGPARLGKAGHGEARRGAAWRG